MESDSLDRAHRVHLEELLARGEVKSAILFEGGFSASEVAAAQKAYEIGLDHGRIQLKWENRRRNALILIAIFISGMLSVTFVRRAVS